MRLQDSSRLRFPFRFIEFGPSPLVGGATMPSADFCPPIAPPRDGASPRGPTGRSPRVLRCYFPPTYPSHIHPHLPCDIGLCIYVPARPDGDASDALHVLRAGSLPAPSSRHRLTANALGVQLVVPVTKVHRGLAPPSRSALPGAHKKKPASLSACGPLFEDKDPLLTDIKPQHLKEGEKDIFSLMLSAKTVPIFR
jgi:hypothetical protein